MNPVPVLLITYNRLPYSVLAFESILRNPGLPVQLMIWDNGSTDGTAIWLDHLWRQNRPEIKHIKFSDKNVGLAPACNEFFRRFAQYPFVVKVDNDTVLPDNWLRDLMDVMTDPDRITKLGAVSGTCLRPYGLTFDEWVQRAMVTKPFGDYKLHYNSYVLGTGVLINMEMMRERGLLFEHFPRSIWSGQMDSCPISGWTAYTREAEYYDGWHFAFYSKVRVKLLNIHAEHVLSNDFPDYDQEIEKVRKLGDHWWESVGGLPGVRKYAAERGGNRSLTFNPHELIPPEQYRSETPIEVMPQLLTEASHLQERATPEFWEKRIAAHGTTASTFLATPHTRINEFTEWHMDALHAYATCEDVLDVGCGWGRMSLPIDRIANSYIGVDFMPALIEKARESMPGLDFRVADAKALPFADEAFDVVVAITCLSSFAGVFEEVLKELKRVLRPRGVILFLEERFARIDWKLKN